jgi:hypothetical protein
MRVASACQRLKTQRASLEVFMRSYTHREYIVNHHPKVVKTFIIREFDRTIVIVRLLMTNFRNLCVYLWPILTRGPTTTNRPIPTD